jgi:hypothetical protein
MPRGRDQTKTHGSRAGAIVNNNAEALDQGRRNVEPCSRRKARKGMLVLGLTKKFEFIAKPIKKPGAGFRPGTVPEFQFHECTDLRSRVKCAGR